MVRIRFELNNIIKKTRSLIFFITQLYYRWEAKAGKNNENQLFRNFENNYTKNGNTKFAGLANIVAYINFRLHKTHRLRYHFKLFNVH